MLCCIVLCSVASVVSDSVATPWAVTCQVPLSVGILQARMLEWVAMPSSRGSSQPRNQIHISDVACIAGSLPTEPSGKPEHILYQALLQVLEM